MLVIVLLAALLIYAALRVRRPAELLPTDDEVAGQILTCPAHFFTPRASKNAKVRYSTSVVTAKKWTVTPEISGEADVTNFEGSSVVGPDTTPILIEQKLACTVKVSFSIELDADAAFNLYDAGIRPGNSSTPLRLYLNDTTGPYWQMTYPFFKSVPMTADVKTALGHTITGEGSAVFVYPTGSF